MVNEYTYYLDPDYRKAPPVEGAYCVRCQKAIKGQAVGVLVNWNELQVREVKGSLELLGNNCWKIITRQ